MQIVNLSCDAARTFPSVLTAALDLVQQQASSSGVNLVELKF
jgi:hypothetical protein